MFLKIICLCLVAASTFAAPSTDDVPSERQQPSVIPIVSLSAEYEADGKFKYSYETGNGIKREETAYDKNPQEGKTSSDCSNEGGEDDDDSGEIHVQEGSYSYTAPDGTLVSVRYIADENGFQPINEHITFGSKSSSKHTDKKDLIMTIGRQVKDSNRKPQFGDKLVESQKNINQFPKENVKVPGNKKIATNKEIYDKTHKEQTMTKIKEKESDDTQINENSENSLKSRKESKDIPKYTKATQNAKISSEESAKVSKNVTVKELKSTNKTNYESINTSGDKNISMKLPMKLGVKFENKMTGEVDDLQGMKQKPPKNSTKNQSKLKQSTEEHEKSTVEETELSTNLTENLDNLNIEKKINSLEKNEKQSQGSSKRHETNVTVQKENIKMENKSVILEKKLSEGAPKTLKNDASDSDKSNKQENMPHIESEKPAKDDANSSKGSNNEDKLLRVKPKTATNITDESIKIKNKINFPDQENDKPIKNKEDSSQRLPREHENSLEDKLKLAQNVIDESKKTEKHKNMPDIETNMSTKDKVDSSQKSTAKSETSNKTKTSEELRKKGNITVKDEQKNSERLDIQRSVKDDSKPSEEHMKNKTSFSDASTLSGLNVKKEINENTYKFIVESLDKKNKKTTEKLETTPIKHENTNQNSTEQTENQTKKFTKGANEEQKSDEKNLLEKLATANRKVEYGQKSIKEVAKHERIAENAAKTAIQAAQVAGDAANTAEKAAKDTEKFVNIAKNPGNGSRELAIEAAKEHAELAGKAAAEASHAAEMAEIAADDAKKAAKAAEKVVQLVQSAPKPEDANKFAKNVNSSASDIEFLLTKTVNVVKDAKQQAKTSRSLSKANKIDDRNVNMTISNEHAAQSKFDKQI